MNLKKHIKKIREINNLSKYDENLFYWGPWEYRHKITKWIKKLNLFKSLKGINEASCIHDKHFYYLSQIKTSLIELFLLLMIVNLFFLFNLPKYSIMNDNSRIKLSYRVILGVVSYKLVMIGTPWYMWGIRKKQKSNNK